MNSISSASYQRLAADNARLKARIAELEANRGPIAIDPADGKISVDQLSIGPLKLETLEARAPALRKAGKELEKPETWTSGGKQAVEGLLKQPVVVDEFKARIPLPFVNSLLEKIAGAQLAKAGLSEVTLQQSSRGQLKVSGRVKKGITLPFEATGALGATPEGKVKFSLQSSKLGGIPMPNFLVSLATKLAGDSLEKSGLEVDAQNFTIDPGRHKPKNLLFQLRELSLDDNALTVSGSAPKSTGKSKVSQISRAK